MQTFTDTQIRELARKRVEFRSHLIVYLVTNGALWTIWWLTGHGYMWPIWPMIGWGLVCFFTICLIIVLPEFCQKKQSTED